MKKKPSILYLDDEVINLHLFKHTFDDRFHITTASSSSEALKMINSKRFDMVICDQQRPDMKGTDFLKQVQKVAPQTPKMLLTAFDSKFIQSEKTKNNLKCTTAKKPWTEDYLLNEINQTMRPRKPFD